MVAAGADGARRWTRMRVARGGRNGARLADGPDAVVVLRWLAALLFPAWWFCCRLVVRELWWWRGSVQRWNDDEDRGTAMDA